MLNGILGTFFALLFFVFMWYPVTQPMIDQFLIDNPDIDSMTAIMIQLLSFFVLIGISLAIISYINPSRIQGA